MFRAILAVGMLLMLAFLCFGVLLSAAMRIKPASRKPPRVASTAPGVNRSADAVLRFVPASTAEAGGAAKSSP